MLWLSLAFPRFPLEVLALPAASTAPVMVIADERVVVADTAAAMAGVTAGMRLAAAWARLPQLAVLERRPELEAAALRRLACWAGGYTPEVCLASENELLLEIGGCLRLFGGLDALLAKVGAGGTAQGFTLQISVAPTARAASLLNAVAPGIYPDLAAMRAALLRLPVAMLAGTAEIAARLRAFGLECIGELHALPRAALMRRIGTAPLHALAQALGELPDPRPRFVFPDSFAEKLELPARVDHAAALLFAAQRLVAALCGWLVVRNAGIRSCLLWLEHERGRDGMTGASRVELGFSSITRDQSRMVRVLRERLERLHLSASVVAIRLEAMTPEALPGRSGQLFSTGTGSRVEPEAIAALIEGLQARMGQDSVQRMEVVAEHRPECAQRLQAWPRAVARTAAPPTQGLRPFWLLPQPEALSESGGKPQRHGPLKLIAGPERIESGWWDQGEGGAVGDVRRDYFIACSSRQEWLWIFRSAAGWFLHGVFA